MAVQIGRPDWLDVVLYGPDRPVLTCIYEPLDVIVKGSVPDTDLVFFRLYF